VGLNDVKDEVAKGIEHVKKTVPNPEENGGGGAGKYEFEDDDL